MKYIKVLGFKDFALYCFFYMLNLIISIPLKFINFIAFVFEKLSNALYSIPGGTAYIPKSLNKRVHKKASEYKKHMYPSMNMDNHTGFILQQHYSR